MKISNLKALSIPYEWLSSSIYAAYNWDSIIAL